MHSLARSRRLAAHGAALGLIASALTAALMTSSASAAAQRSIDVTGPGISTYPAFAPGIRRYGIHTTDDSTGTVEVAAAGRGENATILVNGQPSDGTTQVTGLERGDEVSVILSDADGGAAYSYIYLPPEFPELTVTVDEPGQSDGLVGLTLSRFRTDDAPFFATVVDDNGVPAYLLDEPDPTYDLAVQPNGSYSYSVAVDGPAGYETVELDETFTEIDRHRTDGLVHTDNHDVVLLENGNVLIGAYEYDSETELTDSVIQELDPQGNAIFEWNSREELLDESVFDYENAPALAPGDYAHFNSIWEMADGHLLISLRHTSSVIKLARFDDAALGVDQGDIIWRLGGRSSDFDFVDDPFPGGPCAQHTASETDDGTILILDNGSAGVPGFGDPLCIDPADPAGDPIARPFTRVTEYALDESTGEATLASRWDADFLAIFASSAFREPDGNTLLGFAGTPDALAIELDEEQEIIWRLEHQVDPGVEPYQTYRATRFPGARDLDKIEPVVELDEEIVLGQGQAAPTPEPECTDRGGSRLVACDVEALDTSTPGAKTFSVTARDGAGNTTTESYPYTVTAAPTPDPGYQPDAAIKAKPKGSFVGRGKLLPAKQKLVRVTKRPATRDAVLRIINRGDAPDRFTVRAGKGNKGWKASYRDGKRNVTGKVARGKLRTKRLDPGESVQIRVRVRRTGRVDRGDHWTQRITVRSVADGSRDRVIQRLLARR